MNRGWIKLWRKFMDWRYSPYVEKRPFNKCEAFLDLLMRASHKDHQCGAVWVKRGDVLTSQAQLADRWRWDRKKVRNYLRNLERGGEIVRRMCTKYAHLSICNYDTYQGTSPHTPHKVPTINNGKNEKKEEELVNEKSESVCFPSSTDDYEIQQQLKRQRELS